MKVALTLIVLLASLSSAVLLDSATTDAPKITKEDLNMIVGEWTGTITYIDYQSNNPFTMPADLVVTRGKNESTLKLSNSYPNEPKANNTDQLKVNKDGTQVNKVTITSRQVLASGQIQIQAEEQGKDDNKTALIRHTYLIGKNQFVIRKEVQFEGASEWIKRNEFSYERKG